MVIDKLGFSSVDTFSSWQTYQNRLKRFEIFKQRVKEAGKWVLLFSGLAVLAYCFSAWTAGSEDLDESKDRSSSSVVATTTPQAPPKASFDKGDVQTLLKNHQWGDFSQKTQVVRHGNNQFSVVSSIDPNLQDFIAKKLYTRTSRYIGIVVAQPETGKILALVNLDKEDPDNYPCVGSVFPAASIFKIVSAAAAVEVRKFTADHRLPYNGQSHTLYKNQLTNKTNQHTNWVTLKDAFAKSVNPVFGKIGSTYLGREGLLDYGSAFGFNQRIAFEIPLSQSAMHVDDNAYHWAEVASGFNKDTVMTPIHGAMIAGAVVNGGILIEPTMVERIENEQGEVVYTGQTTYLRQAIEPDTAKTMQQLMAATIHYGTSSRSFRGYAKDRVLSKLSMGGKTGSINNRGNDLRYDWFVGYARENDGPEKIAVSIVVAHDTFIGTKSSQYAKMIMKYYFENVFEKRTDTAKSLKKRSGGKTDPAA